MRANLVVVFPLILLTGCVGDIGNGDGVDNEDDRESVEANDPEMGSGTGEMTSDPDRLNSCTGPTVPVAPLRRLTRTEHSNALADLLSGPKDLGAALPRDARSGLFNTNRGEPVSILAGEKLMLASEQASANAASRILNELGCSNSAGTDCIRPFVERLGRRAYRRPLLEDEVADQLALFDDLREQLSATEAMQAVIERFLLSPFFLYVFEDGVEQGDVERLSPYSLAMRLSSFLLESIPDEALLDAAEEGRLDSTSGLLSEVNRLLARDEAKDAAAHFHDQWLDLEALPLVEKDAALFPDFSPELTQAMEEETTEFVREVLFNDAPLSTLLTSQWGLPSGPLADFYGVTKTDESVSLPTYLRQGILTHPSFLSVHAHADQSSLVKRGTIVRRSVLCHELPDPPDNVDDELPEPTAMETTRDRVEQHRSEPVCLACHELIDELGFAFESFDAVGRYREKDGIKPVDPSGTVVGTSFDGPYQDVSELMPRIADSEEFELCMVHQWFRYATRRLDSKLDECTLAAIQDEWAASSHTFPELVAAIVSSDGFRYRAKPMMEDAK